MSKTTKIGGGFIRENSGLTRAASWPFARLVFGEQSVRLSVLGKKITLAYADIQKIFVSKAGYVYIDTAGGTRGFGFIHTELKEILRAFQEKGVATNEVSITSVNIAQTVNNLLAFLAIYALLVSVWPVIFNDDIDDGFPIRAAIYMAIIFVIQLYKIWFGTSEPNELDGDKDPYKW